MDRYKDEIIGIIKAGEIKNKSKISRYLKEKYEISNTADSVRKYVSKIARDLEVESTAIAKECDKLNIPLASVGNYWYKGKHFSIHVKGDKAPSYDEIREDLIQELKEYSPSFPIIKRTPVKDGHLLVMDPADIHIGKLARAIEGEEYNKSIAVQRVKEGIQGILDKSSGWNIDKVLFIGGNDILHIDTPTNRTTKGTQVDMDGMWYEAFLDAKKLYVESIETLLSVAPVHFTFNPSNHDYISGFMLADVISSWFRKCKDITFDTSIRHRKYFTYYKNLIGTTHGDGAKMTDLPLLMANECKQDWAITDHRYMYTHHVHHKTSKDFPGITCESLRSPSGSDAWHSKKGYIGNPKAIEGFIHHKTQGQVARLTHLF
jgi:hypothetical protein